MIKLEVGMRCAVEADIVDQKATKSVRVRDSVTQ